MKDNWDRITWDDDARRRLDLKIRLAHIRKPTFKDLKRCMAEAGYTQHCYLSYIKRCRYFREMVEDFGIEIPEMKSRKHDNPLAH